MPKGLQGMLAPTLMLWIYSIAAGAASALASDFKTSPRADYVSHAAGALIIASWVSADAQKRGRALCYDYLSFVFFAWPVVVPIYLFRTRGLRAFITLLCFLGISLTTILAAVPVLFIRSLLAHE